MSTYIIISDRGYFFVDINDRQRGWENEIERIAGSENILYVAKQVPFPGSFQPFETSRPGF